MKTLLAATLVCALVAGCGGMARRAPEIERDSGTAPPKPVAAANVAASVAQPPARGGGYYQDDGPGDNPPPNLDKIADADPKMEPLRRAANNPYTVFGQQYVPYKALTPYKQTGVGSWYGRKFHGQRTSSGELYDMYGMTAAHATLPLPSYARVTNLANGKSVIVRLNDRGPFHSRRIIDLSYTAAYKLGYASAGSARVEVEAIMAEEMPLLAARRQETQPVVRATTQPAESKPEAVAETKPVAQVATIESRPVQDERANAPIPVDAEAGGIFLQLGAFSARDNADSFRNRVYQQLAWLNDAIQIHSRNGMYRLHLGPFRDRDEATSMAEKIRAELDFKPLLISK